MARSSSSLLRRTLWLLLLAVVIGLSVGGLLLSGYLIKLDEEIRSRFAGSRWALPAQVYAAAQDLYPGRNLSAADLRHELERLGYRPAGTLSGPGTFVAGKNRIDIEVRAFEKVQRFVTDQQQHHAREGAWRRGQAYECAA